MNRVYSNCFFKHTNFFGLFIIIFPSILFKDVILCKSWRNVSLFSVQFDGEPGEIAKDACAEFCKNQKLALEQLKVCN